MAAFMQRTVFWNDGRNQVATVLCFEEALFVSGARVLQALVYIHRQSGPMEWQLDEQPTSTRIDMKGLRSVPYMKIRNSLCYDRCRRGCVAAARHNPPLGKSAIVRMCMLNFRVFRFLLCYRV